MIYTYSLSGQNTGF